MNYAVASYISVREMPTIRVGADDELSSEELTEFVRQARVIALRKNDWRMLADFVGDYVQEVGATALDLSWPPAMPFPVCFVSADGPLDMRGDLGMGFNDVDGISEQRTRLLGFLVAPSSLHALFTWVGSGKMSTAVLVTSGAFLYGSQAAGLLLHAVGAAFDRAATTTLREHRLEGAAIRKIRRELHAPNAPVPRAFYTVDVVDRFRWEGQVKRGIVACGPCMSVGHRHDVRSHNRILIRRGPLTELTAKVKRDLERRKYVICTGFGDDLPDELDALVRARGVRHREGEYLAVLHVRVREGIRGPADRPYVPAAWRVAIHQAQVPEELR